MENIIPVVTKTKSDLENEIKLRISSKTPVTTRNESATSNIIAETVAESVGGLYEEVARNIRNSFLSTATGVGLDRLADYFSLTRSGSQRAIALGKDTFKFYINLDANESVVSILSNVTTATKDENTDTYPNGSASSSFVIKAGTYVSTEDGKVYITQDDVTITEESKDGFTGVISSGPGDIYNVGEGDLTQHNILENQPELGAIVDYIKCTNVQAINSGTGVEEDENFRWRIAQKAVASANANQSSIREAILSVPGISDFFIEPRIHGNGTTGIMIQTVSPVTDDGTIRAVKETCEIVAAHGERFYVSAPEYLAVTMGINILYKHGANRETIQNNVNQAVIEYINQLPMGGEIIIKEIIRLTMQIDELIKDMSFQGMGYGVYNRMTAQVEDYTPLRISNQRCNWNQKFFVKSGWLTVCDETPR